MAEKIFIVGELYNKEEVYSGFANTPSSLSLAGSTVSSVVNICRRCGSTNSSSPVGLDLV